MAAFLVGGILFLSRLLPNQTSPTHGGSAKTTAYNSKSCEGAKWSKIYGGDRLFPAKARFQKIAGWDRKNLAITGTIENQQLLLLLQNGEWKVNRLSGLF